MPETKNQPEEQRYVPQIIVPFRYASAKKPYLIPTNCGDGIFIIKSAVELHFQPKAVLRVRTGICVSLPDYMDIAPCMGVKRDEIPSFFPRCRVHAALSTRDAVLKEKSILLLAPTLITASSQDELVLTVTNISNEIKAIYPGDDLAQLVLTVSPIGMFNIVLSDME